MRTAALVLALVFAPVAGAAYKCVDEQGRTQIGDVPPASCARVPVYEVSPSGHVLRRIDPTPTPEQAKAKFEEEQRRKQAEKLAADQKRKDEALLASFASVKEFDTARDRNIEPLTMRIESAQERMRAIDERLAKIDEEMEFYKAGQAKGKSQEVPQGYFMEQDRLKAERKGLQGSIASNEREIKAQRERFDRDKKRWIELRSGTLPAGTVEPATAAAADRKYP